MAGFFPAHHADRQQRRSDEYDREELKYDPEDDPNKCVIFRGPPCIPVPPTVSYAAFAKPMRIGAKKNATTMTTTDPIVMIMPELTICIEELAVRYSDDPAIARKSALAITGTVLSIVMDSVLYGTRIGSGAFHSLWALITAEGIINVDAAGSP